MKRRFIILTLVLIFVDQIIKIVIAKFFMEPHVHVDLINGVLSFCPFKNTKFSIVLVRFAALFNIDMVHISPTPVFQITFSILAFVLILFLSLYYIYVSKKYRGSVYYFFNFMIAAVVCSCIDTVFWGGSIDYIGLFDWFIFDFKDAYSNIGIAFMVLWCILYFRDYMKLSKEQRKKEQQETKISDWIKKGFPLER